MFGYPVIGQAVHDVLAVVGALVLVGGTAAAAAYELFMWFGKGWIERNFKEQLEQLKHEQQKEIEQIRHQINSVFSRISKVHEKEFEVLPTVWQLLQEAYGITSSLVSAFKQMPDLNRMGDLQFEEFVKSSRLVDYAKDELRRASNRMDIIRMRFSGLSSMTRIKRGARSITT